jgi:hypothetical protein
VAFIAFEAAISALFAACSALEAAFSSREPMLSSLLLTASALSLADSALALATLASSADFLVLSRSALSSLLNVAQPQSPASSNSTTQTGVAESIRFIFCINISFPPFR